MLLKYIKCQFILIASQLLLLIECSINPNNTLNSKLLVTTGIPITSTIHSEVIDIIDPKNKCHPLKNFPIQASFATGGLLQNKAPVICGGYTGNIKDSNLKCFIIDKSISSNHSIDLIYERTGSASVVLNNSQLWITGGDPRGPYPSQTSSEFVSLTKPTELGPYLPMDFFYHCATKLNDSFVLLTGGVYNNGKTLLVDTLSNYSMISGPKMKSERYSHACGTFMINQKPILVVAGGTDGQQGPLNSTEIWYPNSNEGWINGPDIPEPCFTPSMITSPNGEGVILVGCFDMNNYSPNIYELIHENGNLIWKIKPQKLKYPRTLTVSMLIPDEITTCTQYIDQK